MDWFSWLSKTHLDPSFIHEYSVAFSDNQLEEDDISYFNHEFLQSMGIAIAKHRLEILKLARRSGGSGSNSMAKLIMTIKKTNRTMASYVRTWVHRRFTNNSGGGGLIMVKKRSYSSRWKDAMVKRNARLVTGKQGSATFLLTGGNRVAAAAVGRSGGGGGARVDSFSSPVDYKVYHDHGKVDDGDHGEGSFSDDEGGGDSGGDGGGYWSGRGVEEIKWDAMFQNLKPT